MKPFLCFLVILLPVLKLTGQAHSQPKSITGKVISTTAQQAVEGAVITALNSRNNGISNADGSFIIRVNTVDTLMISHISFATQRITVNGNTVVPLQIFLNERSNAIGEVTVSTGYQNISKERATGSFNFINKELLNRRVSTNILDRIENLAPGILFDRNQNAPDPLLIRGRSTIFSDAKPLIVLDNFPYDGDVNNINPNDVESITILKDAAAASIWGARAGNGVIVITSKKGKTAKPTIEFNSNTSFMGRPNVEGTPTISSSDYIELEKYLFSKNYYDNDIANTATHPPLTPVVEILAQKRNGTITDAEADARINAFKNQDVKKDIQKYLYRTAINQQYSLNVSGNTGTLNYFLSGGYDNNASNLVGSNYNRITLRSLNTFKVSKNLQIDAGITYFKSTGTSGNNPGYSFVSSVSGKSIYPYASLADVQGNPLPLYIDYRTAYTDTAGGGKLLNWQYVPLSDIHNQETKTSINDYIVNTGLTYRINNFLSTEIKYQYENAVTTGSNLYNEQSYYARNMINRYTQLDAASGTLSYPVPVGGILDRSFNALVSHQGRAQLNYEQSFKNAVHKIIAIAGWEIKSLTNESNSFRYYGYKQEGSSVISAMDYVTRFKLYNSPGIVQIPNPESVSETTDRFLSFYANAAYSYKSRYTISGSARNDAANLFGVKTNQKGTPLWSVGTAWQINNESFYNSLLIPVIKLRATYGYNGNFSRLTSALATTSYLSGAYTTNATAAVINNPPNANLTWEQIRMINVGIDFELKNKSVTGSIEYYRKKAVNLLGKAPVDPTLGLVDNNGQNFFYGNVAGMKGRGIDVEINTTNINRSVKWFSTFLFTYSHSEVSQYLMPVASSGSAYLGTGTINPVIGKPLFSLYSYKWFGLDAATGDPLGYSNGHTSKDYTQIINLTRLDSMAYNGPVQPTYYGAFRNTINYKNLSLSFNISYQLGYYFRRPSLSYTTLFSSWTGHSDYAKRWQKPGDEKITNVPSLIYPANSANRDAFYAYSETLVEKGDHIRLQDITVNYTVYKKQWKYLPAEQVRFYLYADNLGVIWTANKEHIDPYYLNTPYSARRMALGLNLIF